MIRTSMHVDGREITDEQSWFEIAPPEKGNAQWRYGYSAKEQARSWLRGGRVACPDEILGPLEHLAAEPIEDLVGTPEAKTKLDNFGRARQHDLLLRANGGGRRLLVVGIEAKACEGFDGLVADRASAEPPSNKRARCNLMAQALFGRPVFDVDTGQILDSDLASHGYQLWTAAVGTLIEASDHPDATAVVMIQQFVPENPSTGWDDGDNRNWPEALQRNSEQFDRFARDLKDAGGVSHPTEWVEGGLRLELVKVESPI